MKQSEKSITAIMQRKDFNREIAIKKRDLKFSQVEISNWLMYKYAQPNKPTAMDLWQEYNVIRKHKNWPALKKETVYRILNSPEVNCKVQAFKMALATSSEKPAMLTYDNL